MTANHHPHRALLRHGIHRRHLMGTNQRANQPARRGANVTPLIDTTPPTSFTNRRQYLPARNGEQVDVTPFQPDFRWWRKSIGIGHHRISYGQWHKIPAIWEDAPPARDQPPA